jgi:hypothetical protein
LMIREKFSVGSASVFTSVFTTGAVFTGGDPSVISGARYVRRSIIRQRNHLL